MKWRFLAVLITAVTSLSLNADYDGAALFLEGRDAVARLAGGQVEVSAERFPCAKCHGADGRGSREGGTVMPPVTWNRLRVATGKRPAYDREAIVDAVVNGRGASGRALGDLMPRYSASPEALDALVDYLTVLDGIQTVGISSTSIAIEAPSGNEHRLGFMAAVEQFNQQGGAYGRTLAIDQQSDVLVNADHVLEMLEPRMQASIRRSLLSAIREDGWSSVDIPGENVSPALLYEMKQAGLEFLPGAQAVMLLEAIDTRALHSRSVYAPYAIAGPILEELVADGVQVNLVGTGEQAIAWAVRHKRSADAAKGYLAGMLLQDALMASGRTLTRAVLDRELDALDLDARGFVIRSD